ncbi:MAG: helix-turn-helix transcriptional regulator [Peptostreptococcaceae bacterium]
MRYNGFSYMLRIEREKLGITQKQMSEKLNLPPTTYNGYETGKRSPHLDIVRDIAEVLNISVDYLLSIDQMKLNENTNIIQILDDIKDLDEKDINKIKEYIQFIKLTEKKK